MGTRGAGQNPCANSEPPAQIPFHKGKGGPLVSITTCSSESLPSPVFEQAFLGQGGATGYSYTGAVMAFGPPLSPGGCPLCAMP